MAAAGRPTPRSNLGRSPGSTQTSGPAPSCPASATRSLATAPSDRSRTVRASPLASRGTPTLVSSADQPAMVPPTRSTRSVCSGSTTGYHSAWPRNARWRLCQARNRRACSSWAANRSRSSAARAAVTRRLSAAMAAFSACRPRQALTAPAAARPPDVTMPTPVSAGFSQPAQPSRTTTLASSAPPAADSLAGRLISVSSRRCAASQPGLSRSGSGGTGRRGGSPGSACSSSCCQPRLTWPAWIAAVVTAAPRGREGRPTVPAAPAAAR